MNRRLRTVALAFGIVLATPAIAYATYPVIDVSAIAKLGEQLSKMQKQIDQLKQHTEWLTKLSAQAQGTIDAIGAAGQIALPVLNMQKLTNRIMRDIQCLTPDLSGLMPGINLDDLDFFSICEGRSIYRKSLWFDPKESTADPVQVVASGQIRTTRSTRPNGRHNNKPVRWSKPDVKNWPKMRLQPGLHRAI